MRILTILACAALLVVAGCGDDDEETAGPATQATTPAATDTGGDTTGGAPATVELTATEFAFDPSDPQVDQAGPVEFTMVNEGQAPHAVEIEGQGIEEESETVQGGQTATLTVDLEPGEYVMYCPVGDHREQGMEGTVTVAG